MDNVSGTIQIRDKGKGEGQVQLKLLQNYKFLVNWVFLQKVICPRVWCGRVPMIAPCQPRPPPGCQDCAVPASTPAPATTSGS